METKKKQQLKKKRREVTEGKKSGRRVDPKGAKMEKQEKIINFQRK